jgi:hypothetical protein
MTTGWRHCRRHALLASEEKSKGYRNKKELCILNFGFLLRREIRRVHERRQIIHPEKSTQ